MSNTEPEQSLQKVGDYLRRNFPDFFAAGPLEYLVNAPQARALARKRLAPLAPGYLAGLCE